MKKKYLPLYYEWMETGELPTDGLCGSINGKNDELFSRMKPDPSQWQYMYWGNEGLDVDKISSQAWLNGFNPLRQNIVLFLAAMNNEL